MDDYNYDLNKQELRINDLKRYGIETVLIDSYNQIPTILSEIKGTTKMQKHLHIGFCAGIWSGMGKNCSNIYKKLGKSIMQGKL